jgi:hypothetical protein
MKTRGLTMFSAMLMSMMTGGSGAVTNSEKTTVLHGHGTMHRRGKLKGWMKENKKCSFNTNK